jgi:hypothetical protein
VDNERVDDVERGRELRRRALPNYVVRTTRLVAG